MDLSKEYILMCEKADEIQNRYSDYDREHHFIVGSKCRELRTEDNGFYYGCCFDWDNEEKIWLPRQDQLQEMLLEELNPKNCGYGLSTLWNMIEDFHEWAEEGNTILTLIGEGKELSMEMCWMFFVMKTKYNKTWNGKDWI